MRIFILFFSIGLFLFSCKSEDVYYENAICITHINTIDAKNGLDKNMTLIIKDGRIIRKAPSQEINLSNKNTIIDGTDKYIIPGLWDAHVHFAYIEELAPSMFDLFLSHGITSVRDTGGKIDVVKKWKTLSEQNPMNAPRVMISGPLIDGTPTVYDGSTPRRPELGAGSATVEEITALIENLDSQGVDFLKAYEMLSPEQFQTVMDMAKKKKLKVTGHIPLSMDAISVSNAGIHSMEHLRNLEMSCVENPEVLLIERRKMLANGKEEAGMTLRASIHKAQKTLAIKNQDAIQTEKVLNTLAKNQTWQVPTMALNTILTRGHVTRDDWRETFKLLPDSIGEQWLAGSKRIAAMQKTKERLLQASWAKDMVKKINDKKIGIMAGTDCPIAYLTPGYSLHEELAILVESGLTPLEAIASATINPSKYFSLDNELGLIKEGFLADFVLLNKNPLKNIKNTLTIDAVIKFGNYYSRENLDELLKNLQSN